MYLLVVGRGELGSQKTNYFIGWLVMRSHFCIWWVWKWAQHVQLDSGTKIESLVLVEVEWDSQLLEGHGR